MNALKLGFIFSFIYGEAFLIDTHNLVKSQFLCEVFKNCDFWAKMSYKLGF